MHLRSERLVMPFRVSLAFLNSVNVLDKRLLTAPEAYSCVDLTNDTSLAGSLYALSGVQRERRRVGVSQKCANEAGAVNTLRKHETKHVKHCKTTEF